MHFQRDKQPSTNHSDLYVSNYKIHAQKTSSVRFQEPAAHLLNVLAKNRLV